MARPSRSAASAAQSKAHYTKQQLKDRKMAEQALSTSKTLNERPEVLRNAAAHAEFTRLNALLSSIGKNDAIYETVINRYCQILAECVAFEEKREKIYETAQRLEEKLDTLGDDVDFPVLSRSIRDVKDIYKTMVEIDKQVESKRKMLLSIEKENIMTVAASLRSVPKTTEKPKNPILEALNGED